LPDGESEIFFAKGLDGANQFEIVSENRTNAQVVRDRIDGELPRLVRLIRRAKRSKPTVRANSELDKTWGKVSRSLASGRDLQDAAVQNVLQAKALSGV
jgi:hypothetical protein